ncbi:amino acid deaminase [Alteromonas sediminis]|uniref:Amino acid deaminase n=1 Tax=Alteromonas sediminis TaxID=2259342 RepID=A0A3N5ZDC1_9ALTE|nr:amino acid deaminase [Alteromonas sediminis]RPJ68018.1 amino acid deaminase [Alteromonas sediminis]
MKKANILDEDLVLPAAIILESKLNNNLGWMQAYSERKRVSLAPHGKTTMTPDLFHLQLDAGAWGITLATVEQVAAAYNHGIRRILLANQLIGKANMQLIDDLLDDPEFEFYCLLDSKENLVQLERFFCQTPHTLNVLIEISPPKGRCGCINYEEALALANAVKKSSFTELAGVEFYEGTLSTVDQVDTFLNTAMSIFDGLYSNHYFTTETILFTGAGSAWYDRVAEKFSHNQKADVTYLIRPGCYLIHDKGIYEVAQNKVLERDHTAQAMPTQLQSSLEVWAYVLSTPSDSNRAIVGMGKRDVAFDAGYPIPVKWFRPGWDAPRELTKTRTTKVMDQHSMLHTYANEKLMPGDLIGFATSHPCLTLDKWCSIHLVDDSLTVLKTMKTCFRPGVQ